LRDQAAGDRACQHRGPVRNRALGKHIIEFALVTCGLQAVHKPRLSCPAKEGKSEPEKC
jgi:hypothetical protein